MQSPSPTHGSSPVVVPLLLSSLPLPVVVPLPSLLPLSSPAKQLTSSDADILPPHGL